jgi:hypothetical protein
MLVTSQYQHRLSSITKIFTKRISQSRLQYSNQIKLFLDNYPDDPCNILVYKQPCGLCVSLISLFSQSIQCEKFIDNIYENSPRNEILIYWVQIKFLNLFYTYI